MSWRELPANLLRLLLWRTRINRMQFGVGYVALCFFGAIAMQIVFFSIAASVGSLEAVFDHPEWTAPAFVLLLPIVWGLIANRAHDIGWPGWPIVLLYLVPIGPWLIVMDGALGLLGGAAYELGGECAQLLYALILIPAFLLMIALIMLAAVPGKKVANGFGEPPLPGLWNDLPRSRA